ncbi:MAG: hypothetical protein VX004_09835, partial [SAR324 cluster bacterium]|nr:hypothetical protein [SAR324 cluster bacterium]
MKYLLQYFFILTVLGLLQTACDLREGTIVYDVDFPRADANAGSGGSSSDGSGTHTSTNDFGAGYRVSESGGNSSVIESGAGDTLNITLVKAPTANVMLAVVSVDTGEVTLSTNTLTFTPDNWNIAQTVNLSAVEDGEVDGNQSTNVTIAFSSSSDLLYAKGLPSTDVSVTTVDSGTIISPLPPATGPGITITQSGGNTTVTESGATDTITVVLNAATTDNVTVAINKSNNAEISASPATVTFTPSNWNVAQTVTISAVEDTSVDGDKDTTFTVGVSASGDSNYSAVADASVPVRVIDSATGPISNLSATAGLQLNTLTWSKPSGTTSYTLYWSTSSPVTTGSGNYTISSGDTLTYTHAGLTAGTQYFYAIVANSSGGASDLSNEVSSTPSSYSGCNTSGNLVDNDTSMILHYGFNNNLE